MNFGLGSPHSTRICDTCCRKGRPDEKGIATILTASLFGEILKVGKVDLMKKGLRLNSQVFFKFFNFFVGDIDLIKKGLRLSDSRKKCLYQNLTVGDIDLIKKGLRYLYF